MFLVLHAILTVFVFQTNSFNVKRENYSKVNDVEQKNKTVTTNYNDYNTIKNSKALNLESNIFDKMLSNEMFSIKQYLYEKDLKSSVYMSFKNNVATPTLEINQRWPIEKVTPNIDVISKFENVSSDLSIDNLLSKKIYVPPEIKTKYYKDNHLNNEEGTKYKVIEVRSFSVMPNHNSETLSHGQQAKRQCTCLRLNPHTICSHRSSGVIEMNTEKICTHTQNHITIDSQCTRTPEAYSISLTYFPYYAYPSYFFGITTDFLNTYYHPDVVNNLKLPKGKKHRKIKKPYIDEELEDSEEVDNENHYDYLENDKSRSKINKYPKNELDSQLSTLNYYNSGIEHLDLSKTIHNEYVRVIDRDNFVEDIIEDLKVYYNDAIIKDCYCSVSSFICKPKSMLISIIILLIFNIL